MTGIKLHPRHDIVCRADLEFRQWLLDFEKRHGLTTAEVVRMHSAAISEHMKYEIRLERHGDYDKKGDEA